MRMKGSIFTLTILERYLLAVAWNKFKEKRKNRKFFMASARFEKPTKRELASIIRTVMFCFGFSLGFILLLFCF